MLEMPLFQSVKPAKEGLLIVPGHGVIMTEGIATKRHKIHKGSICVFLRLFVACFSCTATSKSHPDEAKDEGIALTSTAAKC